MRNHVFSEFLDFRKLIHQLFSNVPFWFLPEKIRKPLWYQKATPKTLQFDIPLNAAYIT